MDRSLPVIFIVNGDSAVRQTLAKLLCTRYVTRTFKSSIDFLAAHDPKPPGCIILDLAMPQLDGLAVQAALAATGCRRPIIFFSGAGTIPQSVTALRAGAINFLTKPVASSELFAAIEEAMRIDTLQRRAGSVRQVVTERLSTLTHRERQVFEGVVSGRLNKQIAADLGTVEKTIKVHRARVMRKMRARSLAELVRLAACAEGSG
jgi:FixJ family two-component response regulator